HFSGVKYRQVYPGVDWIFHGNPDHLEYDFVLAPGSDPSKIELAVDGARSLRLSPTGDLLIGAGSLEAVQRKPVIYQIVRGERKYVAGGYVLARGNRFRYRIGDFDRTRELVIDPVLTYSALLGGKGVEFAGAVAIDASGNAYVTGATRSIADFPGAGARVGANSLAWAFVTKLNAAGTAILYSAFVGGGFLSSAGGAGIAVDSSGSAFVAGSTDAYDFPTTPGAFQGGFAQPQFSVNHAFVFKLNPAGTALDYSTYLRGGFSDFGNAIAIDADGNAFVAGETSSPTFPTTAGAFKTTASSGATGFVAKVNPTGAGLVYSTFLGGTGTHGSDSVLAIALDGSGNAYLAGTTTADDFPVVQGSLETTNPLSALGGGFVSKLTPSGSALAYSTYLSGGAVSANGIAVDSSGSAHVVGRANFLNAAGAGSGHAFILKLNPAGSALTYLRKFGGSSEDSANAVAVDAAGNAYIGGGTKSADFPVLLPIQAISGYGDNLTSSAFLVQVDPLGVVTYSTFLGGRNNGDWVNGVAVNSSGDAFITGRAGSVGFPVTPGSAGKTVGDGFDAFIARVAATNTCGFQTTPVLADYPAAGGQSSIAVAANPECGWVAMSNQSWITITSPPAGLGNGVVNYTVQASNDIARTAPISVAGALIPISQADGCTYALTAAGASVPAAGGFINVNLNTGLHCPWTRSALPSWILVSGGPQTGSAGFLFTVQANQDSQPRSATVLIAGQPFVITQAGGFACSYSLGIYTSASFSSNGGISTFDLATTYTCGWSAVSNAPWLTVDLVAAGSNDPVFGLGSGHVNYSVAPNPGATPRVGVITAGGQQFTVTQAGFSPTCVGSPSGGKTVFTSAGGSTTFNVTVASCTWTVSSPSNWIATGSGGTGSGAASITLAANPGSGWRIGTVLIAGQSLEIAQAGTGPAVLSASPASGIGTIPTFAFRFAHGSGASALNVVNILVNSALDARFGCYLAFLPNSGALYLVNDAGDGLLQPLQIPGGSGSVSNSQCTVFAAGSSVTSDSTNLSTTLTVSLSFAASFSGSKIIYLAARDAAQGNTGWQPLGIWRVPGASQISTSVDPATPARGRGTTQTISLNIADQKGWQDLGVVNVLVNDAIDGRFACFLAYARSINVLYLVDDPGYGLLPGLVLGGSPGTLSNSQCTVSNASAVGNGTSLLLTLTITYTDALRGNRLVFAAARDVNDLNNTGWLPVASWSAQ
ncbi:MAG: SBBP repeat-containing protein, partial [Bryobacteraceae bacterium]